MKGNSLEAYTIQQKKDLVVHPIEFFVTIRHLYKMGPNEILWRYVVEFERSNILADTNGGTAGGHYVGRETTQKILCVGLWWPTLHLDSKDYCKACDESQRAGKPSLRDELPLNP